MTPGPVIFELRVIAHDAHAPVVWRKHQNVDFLPPAGAAVELAPGGIWLTAVSGHRFEYANFYSHSLLAIVELRGYVTVPDSMHRPRWDRDTKLYAIWNTERLGDLEKILGDGSWEKQ